MTHVDHNGISYEIKQGNYTASVIGLTEKTPNVEIPKNIEYDNNVYVITSISNSAFENNGYIKSVSFPPDSMLSLIASKAFSGSILESITIPKMVKIIEREAFYSCKCLQKIIFQENSELRFIDQSAFHETKISEITIPSKVQQIGNSVFYSCRNLQKIIFPEDSELRLIDQYAFCRTKINEIAIPPKVQQIGSYAFSNCSNLQKVTFQENSILRLIDQHSFYETKITEIVIPSTVQQIGSSAFSGCKSLQTITFQENSELRLIDDHAFYYTKITEITIPSKVHHIGSYAFHYCSNLQKINFQENSQLRVIGNYAFASAQIDQITIQSHISALQDNSLCGLPEITNIIIAPENKHFKFDNNMLFYRREEDEESPFDVLFYVPQKVEKIVIPTFVKVINKSAFEGCKNLKYLEITKGSKLEFMCNDQFKDCCLETIIVPSNLINSPGFLCYSEAIKEIVIVDDEVEIDKLNFSLFPNLNQISYPNARTIKIERGINSLSMRNFRKFE
ncbi:hypothetical protein M9Y10_018476 [Tritrichomonas musculus]|uniref:Surface antigen BspA-like n=1 Tax=Tritrichomonas musculus TaxID=1915356 RepID=A0ABR2HMJ0_9EUKA